MKLPGSTLKLHVPHAAIVDVAAQVLGHGVPSPDIALLGAPRTHVRKFTLSRIAGMLSALGIDTVARKVDFADLRQADPPFIAHMSRPGGEEFVLVTGFFEWGSILSYSGYDGWILETFGGFSAAFTGICLFPIDEPRTGTSPAPLGLECIESLQMRLIEGFLSEQDCANVMDLASPSFQRSMVSSNGTIGSGTYSSSRTSKTAPCSGDACDAIIQRASKLVGACPAWFEHVESIRYDQGDSFSPHFDPPLDDDGRRIREWTLLAYLNAGFDGGGTFFPLLDLTVRPSQGALLVFRNRGEDGRMNGHSLHAGTPVSGGTKYACNLWCSNHSSMEDVA